MTAALGNEYNELTKDLDPFVIVDATVDKGGAQVRLFTPQSRAIKTAVSAS